MGGDADEGMDCSSVDSYWFSAWQGKVGGPLSPSALVRAPATLYESQEGCIEES